MLASISRAVDAVRSKTYELPLAREYVRHWGMKEAIRELIQNALDSDSPFEYAFDQGTLYIVSRFARLEPSTLVLGTTSKADDAAAIGSFGEGYKIALLVLTRLGYPVEVLNGNRQWVPEFRQSSTFGTEVLCIHESPIQRQATGVEFIVSGLSDEDVALIKDGCLNMQPPMGDVIGTKYGHILPSRPGKLYVGSLFVCETELAYGYDIKPEFLTLERDRQTVSGWDLRSTTKDMWIDHGDFDRLAKMIDEKMPDVSYVEYGSTAMVKEACYELFIKKYPGALIAKSAEEMKSMVARGLVQTIYIGGAMHSQVSTSKSYIAHAATIHRVTTPEQDLKEWFDNNRKYMSRLPIVSFKELMAKASNWRNK